MSTSVPIVPVSEVDRFRWQREGLITLVPPMRTFHSLTFLTYKFWREEKNVNSSHSFCIRVLAGVHKGGRGCLGSLNRPSREFPCRDSLSKTQQGFQSHCCQVCRVTWQFHYSLGFPGPRVTWQLKCSWVAPLSQVPTSTGGSPRVPCLGL